MGTAIAAGCGRTAAAVFTAAFCIYAWTAAPVMGWLDSPEFVAASASLGVAHSPGHPLPALLGKLGTLFPFGDIAFRVNLISAVAAAGASTAVFLAGRSLLARIAPDGRWNDVAAIAAALAFAFSWATWFQALRAEVYALQVGLLAAALTALIHFDGGGEKRFLYLASLFMGLALANHHLIAILFLVPAAVAVFARAADQRPRARAAAITAAFGILGLTAFLYLPLRSAQHPEVNWGAPHTLDRFAWTVSAKAFQKSVGEDRHVSSKGEDTAQVIAALIENVTLPLMVLALLGLYLGVRRRGWRRLALLHLGVIVTTVLGRVLVGFDPETPDHHAYLLPAILALVLLGLAGAVALARAVASTQPRWKQTAHGVAAALVGLAVIVQLQGSEHSRSQSSGYASDELARWELEGLPPRAVLLVSYFQTSFRVWALRIAEQARPDIAVLDRSFLTYPGMAAESRRRYPELAPLIDAPLRAGAPTPIDTLTALAKKRPVFVQLHINLDRAPDPWLTPTGPFARFHAQRASDAVRMEAERIDAKERERLAARFGNLVTADRMGVRDTLLWHDFVRLRYYCGNHRGHAAQLAFEAAWSIAPGDTMLSEIARACRLRVPRAPAAPGRGD